MTSTRNLHGCPSTPWPMHPGCPAEFSPGQAVLGELCPRCACPQPCLSLLCDFMPNMQAPHLLRQAVTWFPACLWTCLLLVLTGPHELDFRSAFFPSLQLLLTHFPEAGFGQNLWCMACVRVTTSWLIFP